jgi:hypothetical protein
MNFQLDKLHSVQKSNYANDNSKQDAEGKDSGYLSNFPGNSLEGLKKTRISSGQIQTWISRKRVIKIERDSLKHSIQLSG